MRPFGTPQQLESRRIAIGKALINGEMSIDEAARRCQVSRRTIHTWKSKIQKSGLEGLRLKKHLGRPQRLKAAQVKKLESILEKGALAAGYESELWTQSRIAEVIKKEFDLQYHPKSLSKKLKTMGWSFQKTTMKPKERNDAKIMGWIRRSWPRIKKSPVNFS